MPISGLAVAYTTVGGIILWSGIKGETLSQTFKDLASGIAPKTNQQPINQTTAADTAIGTASGNASGPVTAGTITSIQNYGLARMVASTYGWGSGQEWA